MKGILLRFTLLKDSGGTEYAFGVYVPPANGGDRAVLTVENLPGFIRVHGGETLDSVGSTVSPAMETKGGADVEMVAPVAGKESGFFRVLRN